MAELVDRVTAVLQEDAPMTAEDLSTELDSDPDALADALDAAVARGELLQETRYRSEATSSAAAELASLGIRDVTDRIEEYLPEAEAALTAALRDRGHDPAAAAAGAAADRMLAGLRHLAEASRTYAATLNDPDADGHAAERQLRAARAAAFSSLRELLNAAAATPRGV